MNPLVSILVPVYNAEKYINQCLDSLLNQTYKNIEIVVVNDGSTDSTSKILHSISDSRLRVIDIENGGAANARNVAIQNVHGSYFLFVDSDDWLDLQCVECCVRQIESFDYDVILFSYVNEYATLSKKECFFDEDIVFDENKCVWFQRRLIAPVKEELALAYRVDWYGTVWGKFYKSSLISDDKFTDLKIIGTAEDVLFNIKLFKKVKSMFYINKSFYHYRKCYTNSLTSTYKKNLVQQFLNLYSFIKETLTDNAEQIEALNNRIAITSMNLGLNELSNNDISVSKPKQIKQILTNPTIHSALQKLKIKYMPLHWRFFYFCARHKMAYLLYLQLKVINRMRQK